MAGSKRATLEDMSQDVSHPRRETLPYSGSREHLADELKSLDVILANGVRRYRTKSNRDLRGLVITDEEVDDMLRSGPGSNPGEDAALKESEEPTYRSFAGFRRVTEARAGLSLAKGIFLGLPSLSKLFNLTDIEEMVILVCVAPEIDSKYGKLYAYLQDDVTKKRPTADLIFRLFTEGLEQRLDVAGILSPEAPLLRYNLISFADDLQEGQPALASRFLKLDDRIVSFLLDMPFAEPRLQPSVEVSRPNIAVGEKSIPSELEGELDFIINSVTRSGSKSRKVLVHLSGQDEGGKRAFADALCRRMNVFLLSADLGSIMARGIPPEWAIKALMREALLLPAVLFIRDFGSLVEDEKNSYLVRFLERTVAGLGWLVVLSGEKEWFPVEAPPGVTFVSHEVAVPSIGARKELWTLLSKDGYRLEDGVDLDEIAGKFRFGRDRIRRALNYAQSIAVERDGENYFIRMRDIYEGCRAQSSDKLASMAQKVKPVYTWDDIVLPEDNKGQLMEICSSVRQRRVVYEDWGFEKKFSLGRGVDVLFTGSSGTGKTMAAEIMANELHLDLYKIDLSMVVSKWVGETEKNLARVFREGRDMNAIIFFDEADALFGKRTEVRDAHDRYANIEVNFLLQKMEEYEGMVILASNFKENIDKAFLRRMHHTVEFPFPDEGMRLQIWKIIFPREAPVADDVDLTFLAKRFKLSGGNIKNAAVTAAFYAAEESSSIGMKHVLKALRREYHKMGTIPLESDFETPQGPTRSV